MLRTLFFVIALAFLSVPGFGADIPSSARADHAGDGYACRFNPHAINAQINALEIKCVLPVFDRQSTGLSTVNACPSSDTPVPLTLWGGETGSDKAATTWETWKWRMPSGVEAESGGWGLLSKFPSQWMRIETLYPYTYVRVGTFQQMLNGITGQPDQGTLHQLAQVQRLPNSAPYPGCGATAVFPRPWAAYCNTYIGCDW